MGTRGAAQRRWNTVHAVRKTQRGLRMTPEELRAYQRPLLEHLVTYARAHVPFYAALYAQQGLGTRAPQLASLPVTNKHLMRQQSAEELLSSEFSRTELESHYSSGTTGEPFETFSSSRCRPSREALGAALHLQHRIALDERILVLSPLGRSTAAGQAQILAYEDDIEIMRQRLRAANATALWAFSSYLGLLAEENARAQDGFRVRLAAVVGEHLDAETRALLQRHLADHVVQLYGLQEVGVVGMECSEQQGFHVHPDFIVEILDESGAPRASGAGEVCITALGQTSMPFIRYNTRDLAELDTAPCPCGLRAPRITRLSGRNGVLFLSKQGDKISLGSLPFSWHFPRQIQRVSILQHTPGALSIEVVPSQGVDTAILLERLRTHLDSRYGAQFDYQLSMAEGNAARGPGKRFAMRSLLNVNG